MPAPYLSTEREENVPRIEEHLVESASGDADRLESVLRELGDRIAALTLAVEGRHEGTRPSLDPVRLVLADALERTLADELAALFVMAKSACGDITREDLGRTWSVRS